MRRNHCFLLLAVTQGDEKTWLFEADIALVDKPEAEEDNQNAIDSKMVKRGLRRSQEYLWIDRVVPYEYTNEISGKNTEFAFMSFLPFHCGSRLCGFVVLGRKNTHTAHYQL